MKRNFDDDDGPGSYRDKEDFLKKLSENYDDIVEINSGGGGIIYSAVHRRLKQKVILKKIRSDKIGAIGREREKKILLGIRHTYLPGILDFWSYEDEVYTVMEFIEGKSFQELLDEGVKFSQRDVIRWTKQLAEVLEYLHSPKRRIIHADIKPSNLMLTSQNNICLIDFNVSLLLEDHPEEAAVGYSEYYAPVEQLIRWGEMTKGQGQMGRIRKNAADVSIEGSASHWDEDATDVDGTGEIPSWSGDVSDATDVLDNGIRYGCDDDTTDILDKRAAADGDEDATDVAGNGEAPAADTTDVSGYEGKSERKADTSAGIGEKRMVKKYGTRLPVDGRSDIYSACACMYHLLTGQRPKPCYADRQIPAEKLLPSVNDAFAHILAHGMEQDPSRRFRDAAQFRLALDRLARSTKRYKRMLRHQDLALLLVLLLFVGSVITAIYGWRGLVREEFEAHMEQATDYYEQNAYQEAVDYLEDHVTGIGRYQNQPDFGSAWYLMGSSFLELDENEEAANAFRSAIFLDSSKPEYYRDYGIALARLGDLAQAEEALKQAEAKGLATHGIALLEGEIALARGDSQAAVESFSTALEADDASIRMRAALELDGIYEDTQENQGYEQRIQLLEAVLADDFQEQKPAILERLAQAYSDAAEITGDGAYAEAAIQALDQLVESGYDTLAVWLNKGVLQQSMADYDGAQETLKEAEAQYPDTYLVSKRLAFLEFERQSSLDSESRDYALFQEYAQQAMERYRQSGADRQQDAEMEYLEKLVDELKALGWLEKE